MQRFCSVFTVIYLGMALTAWADDWPQYRGPRRDDVSRETGLLKDWPQGGPNLLWTFTNSGVGYSGIAVVGDRILTIGGREVSEYLIALDAKSGADNSVSEAWATKVGPKFDFKSNQWSAGPSSTPTVDGELVYALGGNGDLICVQLADGKERWRKNLPSELNAQVNPIGGGPRNLGWGFTWSPLVDGSRLVCVPGGPKGTIAALNKATGDVIWQNSNVTDQAAYTSPMVTEVGGVKQYVVLTNRRLFAVAAEDGRLLWDHPRTPAYGTEVVNSPIVKGAFVFTTVGAGHNCELVKIVQEDRNFRVESVYNTKSLLNHHGNLVLVGEHLFGFAESRGWTCMEFETGKVLWSERARLRSGSITCADGRLYCYEENDGTAALLEVNPMEYSERGKLKIPLRSELRKVSGKVWTPPVVSGGRMFLRDQQNLFCFDVKDRN